MTGPPTGARPTRGDALVAFAAALAVYGIAAGAVLRPELAELLHAVDTGQPVGGLALYGHLLALLHPLASALGGGALTAATAVSAVAAAAAVAATIAASHAAGHDRRRAATTAALVGSCPAVVLFAAQPGPEALVLLGTAAAAWALARLARSGAPRDAVALGGFAAAAVALGGGDPAPLAALAALALGATATARGSAAAAAFAVVALLAIPATDAVLSEQLAKSWLRAYLPLTPVWLAALTLRRHRAAALAITAAMTVCLLAPAAPVGLELEGRRLLPVVLALAAASAALLSRRVALVAVAVGLSIGAARVVAHGVQRDAAPYAAGLVEVAAGAPAALIVADRAELTLVVAGDLTPSLVTIDELTASFEAVAEQETAHLAAFDDTVERAVASLLAGGRRVFLTRAAEERLRDRGYRARHAVAVRLLDALLSRFEAVQTEAAGFRAKELRARA